MPTDSCLYFYECQNCRTLLRPKQGECCVFARTEAFPAHRSRSSAPQPTRELTSGDLATATAGLATQTRLPAAIDCARQRRMQWIDPRQSAADWRKSCVLGLQIRGCFSRISEWVDHVRN